MKLPKRPDSLSASQDLLALAHVRCMASVFVCGYVCIGLGLRV